MIELEKLAASWGVSIIHHTGGAKGYSWVDKRIISLRHGLGEVQARCTLAHELAHHYYGDMPGVDGKRAAFQERRADRWAAERLISTADYELAERLHGPHLGAIAAELGVTRALAEVWASQQATRLAAG